MERTPGRGWMPPMERVAFIIRGLSCASCAIDVGRALRKLPGVVEININYMVNKGYVLFDPTKTTWAAVSEALESRGHKVIKTR